MGSGRRSNLFSFWPALAPFDKSKNYCCYDVIGSNTEIVHCSRFRVTRKIINCVIISRTTEKKCKKSSTWPRNTKIFGADKENDQLRRRLTRYSRSFYIAYNFQGQWRAQKNFGNVQKNLFHFSLIRLHINYFFFVVWRSPLGNW